jgi:predicted metal-dependent peptidase
LPSNPAHGLMGKRGRVSGTNRAGEIPEGDYMNAQSKMTAARTSLVLEQSFFGTLALSLKMQADDTCETAWVNGRSLGYNPTFIESLPHDRITGTIAHEVFHCAMGHPFRRDGRDDKQWNKACDLCINPLLVEAGFKLPDDVLFPSQFGLEDGKSAEWYYSRLQEQESKQDDPNGQGQGQGNTPQQGQDPSIPDPLGEVRDAPTGDDTDGEPAPSEQEWKQRAASALQQAKMRGDCPGGLARQVSQALRPQIDIRSLLLRFFSERSTGDYSWTRPNSRYLSQGLYLPALESKALGDIAVMVDTSGSVDEVSLSYARSIVESVIEECSPSSVTVYYFDSKVASIDRFERGESLTWKPQGGGGTSFVPALEAIELDGQAVCAVCITDLDGEFPDSCGIPVLWLSTSEYETAPFGETVYIDR